MNLDLASRKAIKVLLNKYGAYSTKKLGQNFLTDRTVLRKLIKAANVGKEDIVLEIGPGIGNLTQELAQKAKKIIAVEKDASMVEILQETTKNLKNIEIIKGDVLKIKNSRLKIKNFKLVANIPYYLTSRLLRLFLESKKSPHLMVLIVQKEVAQRICAKPPQMNLLAVSVQFYAQPKIISFVAKKAFWPEPKVDGAIIRLKIKKWRPRIDKGLFFKIVKAGFSQPRKQVCNNISRVLKFKKYKVKSWLLKNNIQPQQRAETLTVEDWKKLTKNFGEIS